MSWAPMSLENLEIKILTEETALTPDMLFLWKRVQILPEKWLKCKDRVHLNIRTLFVLGRN